MNKRKLLLIGGGGHCKSVLDVLLELQIYDQIAIVDMADKIGDKIFGCETIGCDDDLERFFKEGYSEAFITLGSVGYTEKRQDLYKLIKSIGYECPNIIASSAHVSKNSKIGEGNFIGKGVLINADVDISHNTIINTGAIIEHDCVIEDFVHVAPGTVLSGHVKLGYGCHIGTNATVIQGKSIGKNTLIGAGSVVVTDFEENLIAYGVPCKEMNQK